VDANSVIAAANGDYYWIFRSAIITAKPAQGHGVQHVNGELTMIEWKR
jgi:hypothetical protein